MARGWSTGPIPEFHVIPALRPTPRWPIGRGPKIAISDLRRCRTPSTIEFHCPRAFVHPSPEDMMILFRWPGAGLVIALAAGFWSPAAAETAKPGTGPLRRATFEITNEVKVKIPDGAGLVRVWMALP